MKTTIKYYGYDTLLQPTDWRAAAAVVGLCKYFDHFRIDYKILYNVDEKPENYIHGFDGIIYKSDSITEEKYLDFVESYFEKYMTHIKLQNILNKDKLIDEDIVNFKRICTDSFYEKFFENKRFDGSIQEIPPFLTNILCPNFQNSTPPYSRYTRNQCKKVFHF